MNDPPPAPVVGNLKNDSDPDVRIQGYFSVVSEHLERYYVDVTERGIFADTDCNFFRVEERSPECRECTLIINSTTEKPDYWPR